LGFGRPGAAALAGGRQVQRITSEALHLWPTGTAVGDAPLERRIGCRRVPRLAPKECGAALRAGCRWVWQCAGAAQPLAPMDAGLGGLQKKRADLGGRWRRAGWITRRARPLKRAGRRLERDAGGATLGTPLDAPQDERTGRRRGMPSRVHQPLVVLTVARTRGIFFCRNGRAQAAFSAPAGGLLVVGFAPAELGRVPRGTHFLPVEG